MQIEKISSLITPDVEMAFSEDYHKDFESLSDNCIIIAGSYYKDGNNTTVVYQNGKRVEFLEQIAPYNKNYSYRFAKIAYENKDIARHLLESGLVLTYKDGAPNPYAQFENLPQMKENAKYFSKLTLFYF